MKARKGTTTVNPRKQSDTPSSALARTVSMAKRQQKKIAVIAAMETSQRAGATESISPISAALLRTVEEAKLRRKNETMAGAVQALQRDAETPKLSGSSEDLERTVAASRHTTRRLGVSDV